jgi:hypothetical protein
MTLHVTRVEGTGRRKLRYVAACRCGYRSRALRTLAMARFEAQFHERVEALKAEARREHVA